MSTKEVIYLPKCTGYHSDIFFFQYECIPYCNKHITQQHGICLSQMPDVWIVHIPFSDLALHSTEILLYYQLTHNTTCLNTVLVYLTCQMCKMCQFHSQLFHIQEIWVCIQIIQSEWVTQLQLSERGYCCIHIWAQYTNYLTEGMKHDNQKSKVHCRSWNSNMF